MNNELPVAKNAIAEAIQDRLSTLATFVSPGVPKEHFLGAVLVEANMLSVSLPSKDLEDPRVVQSFVKAAFNCAVIGLVPGEALDHAYFVPYVLHRGKSTEHTSIQLIPGYRGYLELAFASGFLAQCDPELWLAGEELDLWHDTRGPQIKHVIPPDRDLPSRENIAGAYCTYQTKAGGAGVVFVTRKELDKVDTRRNVWKTNYPAMCLKTPIRRASKRWRQTRQLAWAVDLDERAERAESQPSLIPDDKVAQEPIDLGALADSKAVASKEEDK